MDETVLDLTLFVCVYRLNVDPNEYTAGQQSTLASRVDSMLLLHSEAAIGLAFAPFLVLLLACVHPLVALFLCFPKQ